MLITLLVLSVLFLGCLGKTAINNSIHNLSDNASAVTSIITPEQTQCPAQTDVTPWIIINPIRDHYVGDVFEINGTTNHGVNDPIKIEIYQQ